MTYLPAPTAQQAMVLSSLTNKQIAGIIFADLERYENGDDRTETFHLSQIVLPDGEIPYRFVLAEMARRLASLSEKV